ncbi:MAG: Spy/CpxP family protein refolding chaperone [Candidatus Krumholzibacteriia bacterium]
MTRAVRFTVAVVLLLTPAITAAQDPLEEHLIPPEAVMRHQRAIDLTREQRNRITQAIREMQGSIVEFEWRVQEASQTLAELLDAAPIDESAALAQVDTLLAAEREIKLAHLQLLIRIKNTLSEQQQEKLNTLWQHDQQEE